MKAGSFIYIHLYVEKNVIENTKVERYREENMIGFGMRILYREPKPEVKEFLKSLYGICFLILGIMIILAYRCIRIYWYSGNRICRHADRLSDRSPSWLRTYGV